MKRLLITLIACCLCILCGAQQKSAKVTLKNGTSVTGAIVEFNPASYITLSVAGFEARFEMADVASIEEMKNSSVPQDELTSSKDASGVIEEDSSLFPDSYTIKVGPHEIEMVLIKGGTFSMGYDGSGSLLMNSEPVHDVTLSSFYINAVPLKKDVVDYIKKGEEAKSASSSVYHPLVRKDASGIVEKLAQFIDLPVILITEAQWEYTATTQEGIFDLSKSEMNYCYDYYDNYIKTSSPQMDPKGPPVGHYYVIRRTSTNAQTLYRHFSTKEQGPSAVSAIRFTLPASSVVK